MTRKQTTSYTIVDWVAQAPAAAPEKKHRGRPVGAKNKNTARAEKVVLVEDCKHCTPSGYCVEPRKHMTNYICPWLRDFRKKCHRYHAEEKKKVSNEHVIGTLKPKQRGEIFFAAGRYDASTNRLDWICPECKEHEFAYPSGDDVLRGLSRERAASGRIDLNHVCKWCGLKLIVYYLDKKYYDLTRPEELSKFKEVLKSE